MIRRLLLFNILKLNFETWGFLEIKKEQDTLNIVRADLEKFSDKCDDTHGGGEQ